MVWQENVHCIVMATGLFENSVVSEEEFQDSLFQAENTVFLHLLYPPAKQMFSGGKMESACLSVCPCICVPVCLSVCVQNTSFCQSASGGIKSHLVTSLVLSTSSNF